MPETIPGLLHRSAEEHTQSPALSWIESGAQAEMTYNELLSRVREFAAGLQAAGFARGDRLASIAGSLPEWVVADFACLALGGVDAPLFSTLTVPQVTAIVRDCGARYLLVAGEEQVAKGLAVRANVPRLQLIAVGGHHAENEAVLRFEELCSRGESAPIPDGDWTALVARVEPDDLASIIYTSGTTGEPKGVMLTHRNFCSNVEAIAKLYPIDSRDVILSFLPVCHVLERTVGHYFPLAYGARIAYAESLLRLRENLRQVEPTLMILVPRVAEAFQDAITKRVAKSRPIERRLVAWAQRVGRARVAREQERRLLGAPLALSAWLAERLVCRKVRHAAGMARLRIIVSGGAALSRETCVFFQSLGVPLFEGYGLTETSPVLCANPAHDVRIGTVGPAIAGVELRIADNGEILARGDCVMAGYYGQPEATAEVLGADGWLHTGDVGELDADGYLRITDRLKEIIVLGNGKNVAPQPIEGALRQSPYIAQAALFGDGRSYVGALIVPHWPAVREWASNAGKPLPEAPEEATTRPEVRRLIRHEITHTTEAFAGFERVHCFELLPQEFTLDRSEITPTLKLRRRVIAEHYASQIATMFRETG